MDEVTDDAVFELMKGLKAIDPARLVRVDRYTDPEAQMIEVHVPVKVDGSADDSRKTRYFSGVLINFNGETMSQSFEIEADSLEEAIDRFRRRAAEVGATVLRQRQDIEDAKKLVLSEGSMN